MPLFLAPFIAPLVAFFTRTVLIKAVLFFSTYTMTFVGIGLATAFMIKCCDISLSGFTALFSQLPPTVWWFFDLINFGVGLRMVICAFITSWMIRWIPFAPK